MPITANNTAPPEREGGSAGLGGLSRPAAAASVVVLSLGAGVQSSALALMAAHGMVKPMPDFAVFADTGDEPVRVYEHLQWLRSPNVLPFQVHIAEPARSLQAALRAGDDMARVPFHVGAGGLASRQCTRNWKLRPIRRKVRELLGLGPRSFIPAGHVEQWVGISTDEAFRMKPSGLAYIHNRHPLLELGLSRRDCEDWLRAHGYPQPPKSSCIFCPFRRNAQWRTLQAQEPDSFREAVELDEWLREPAQLARFHGALFIHQSRVPLAQADLSPGMDAGQPDLFNHECEGMCGV
jgi:hypothetical protein